MKVQLRYFASIREAVNLGQETLDTQATTVAELRDELIARGGGYADALARGKAVRVALNQTMTVESAALVSPAEVAFFPPVTGG
ncbi:molybdopterin converting factor subunit 1 [Hydrogenophaga sp.]|uniref:molybdopterin converting factor subunit 1 n=1 Tax=Hydrogenophaga sp. TaxID=1904254 RepID=UPI0035697B89